MKIFQKIRCACCFVSALSIFMLLIVMGALPIEGLGGVWVMLGVIGVLAAYVACPLKLIMTLVACVVKGFSIGLLFLGFGCVIGALVGLFIGLALSLYCPAVIAIPHYFSTLKHKDTY